MAEKKLPDKEVTSLQSLYPANPMKDSSLKKESPENEKRTEKIITGEIVVRKKSLGRKFAEAFLGDNLKNVKGYALKEVIIPTIKSTIYDVFTGSLSMIFWGTANRKGSNFSNNGQTRAYYGGNSYQTGNSLYSGSSSGQIRQENASRSSRDVADILFAQRSQAEEVLTHLYDLLEEYGKVRVMDYYDSVGYSGDFVNASWGWTDLRGSDIRPVREGFIIILPPVVSLK